MRKFLVTNFLFLTFLLAQNAYSQNYREHDLNNSVAFGLSHTHIFKGELNGEPKWTILPSFMLDYDYYITEKWSAGAHFDMIVETFLYRMEDDAENVELVERSFPVTLVGTGSYKVFEYLSAQVGAGGEFVREGEVYTIIRAGLEGEYEVGEYYEFFLNASYDYRINAYHSLTVGFGIKRFF